MGRVRLNAVPGRQDMKLATASKIAAYLGLSLKE